MRQKVHTMLRSSADPQNLQILHVCDHESVIVAAALRSCTSAQQCFQLNVNMLTHLYVGDLSCKWTSAFRLC